MLVRPLLRPRFILRGVYRPSAFMATTSGTTPNLHLDDVTGERVSKSELKKRQKQRETERKKAEKAASSAQREPPKKKKDEGIDESELNPNVRLFHLGS